MSVTTSPSSPEGPARTAGPGGRRRRPGPRRVIAAMIAIGAVCAAVALRAPAAGAATIATPPAANVGLIPFTGDVYTIDTYGNLIPVTISTAASAPLYNVAGDPLNLTWGQFSSATATSYASAVTSKGTTRTDFSIKMSGLVPNGVYSLFYRTFNPDSANAVCGASGDLDPTVALTAASSRFQKLDSDSFVAGNSGKGVFLASVPGNLLAAQIVDVYLIYHFDGHTYGPVPNYGEANDNCTSSYGIDAMRQMVIVQASA